MSPRSSTQSRSLSTTSARLATAISRPGRGAYRRMPVPARPNKGVVATRESPAGLRAIVEKLHVDPEVLFAQELDDRLQLVPVAAEDPDLGLLDLRLHSALGPLHELDDLARLFDGDALLQLDPLPDAPAPGGFHRAAAQRLERNLTLHQLRLQDIQHLLQLELVLSGEDQRVLLALDVGGTPFEVEALRDLSRRLM